MPTARSPRSRCPAAGGGRARAPPPSCPRGGDGDVVVVVLVAVRGAWRAGRSRAPRAIRSARRRRGRRATTSTRRDEVEPRVEILGDDELREPERDEPEREDADRVRDGDDPAEQQRVPRRAAGADEVRGDDRLAVARGERVRGAPEERDEERRARRRRRVRSLLLDEARRSRPRRRPCVRGASRAPVVERRRGPALVARLRTRASAARTSSGLESRSCG